MDQNADDVVADAWDDYIGDVDSRLSHYADFLVEFLRKQNCRHVLDAACATGIDSIMLLEKGFKVTSVDASASMVKLALKKRLDRRKEKAFEIIKEANWLTLPHNLAKPDEGFDAIICIGNSITHLKDLSDVKLAIQNFHHMLRPGGWLVIDHRNFESIHGKRHRPKSCMYYNGTVFNDSTIEQTSKYIIRNVCFESSRDKKSDVSSEKKKCRFMTYTIQLGDFNSVLKDVFGQSSKHEIYGDYKPLESVENLAFFIHFIQKEL
ncbi:hypothetical protein JTE90_024605 [Oedothorax gibbosus]|uniref:Glycine N-methyltransferase n=1 Tax=Oedothorax gibbosus TaxID=931172 RepID=A0AAV6U2Y2_9ARAC|nr:hypothetical protein JTE90_024605 [Oedothorax gibbosus]